RPSSGSGPARRTPRPPPSAAPGARSWAWATDAPTGITPAPQGTTVPVPRAIPVPRTTPARRAAAAPFVRTARSHGVTTVTSRADVCAGTVGRVGPDGPQKIRISWHSRHAERCRSAESCPRKRGTRTSSAQEPVPHLAGPRGHHPSGARGAREWLHGDAEERTVTGETADPGRRPGRHGAQIGRAHV